MRRATYASVAVATILIIAKTIAWLLTGSVAMLSTLLDSLLDAVASLFTLFAVHHALQPADAEHRFGHGKLEPLAGLVQSAFISGSAVLLLFEAGNRIVFPQPVGHVPVGIGVTIFAILLTFALVRYQHHVVARSGSVAISADALHYKGDLFINLGVMASLVISGTLGFNTIDPIVGAAVAAYLIRNAYKIGRSSFDMLMDRELPLDDRRRIIRLARTHPKVLAVHELKTRTSGRDTFIQMHVEMHGQMTLLQAHAVADQVTERVRDAYPEAEIIIHQDPAGIDESHPAYR